MSHHHLRHFPPATPAPSAARWLLLGLLVMLAACQQNPVSVDYNPDTNFGEYRNYSWETATSGTGSEVEPLLAERVKTAIAAVMEQRGFDQADQGDGDFLVRYFLAATAKTTDSRSRGSVGIGGGSGGLGVGLSMGFPLGGTRVEQRLQLTVDMIDAASGKLAWRATRELALPSGDPGATTARIRKAVEGMLEKFPPEDR